MPESRADKPLTARVWRAMFDFLMKSAPRRTEALARRGLTPNDSRALFSLDAQHGRSMRSLADEWDCDPSNTTWIVDRLETLGLVERRLVAEDRRLKLVALTSKGARTRSSLMQDFYAPPPELGALDVADLRTLERILSTLAAVDGIGAARAGASPQRRRGARASAVRRGQ
jgi:DNA-binding MarR family transcriptional regulator